MKNLNKEDSLALMNLHFTLKAAEADLVEARQKWNAIVAALTQKYRVSPETHELDILNGRFVEKPKQEKTDGK